MLGAGRELAANDTAAGQQAPTPVEADRPGWFQLQIQAR
jgi:hypothetical protein